MKRKLYLSIALLFILICSCSCKFVINSTSKSIKPDPNDPIIENTISSNVTVYNVYSYESTFLSLNDLVEHTHLIIVGTVTKALPVIRIDQIEEGLLLTSIPNHKQRYGNVSSYEVYVDQVVKGNLVEGSTIRVDRAGGFAEGVNEVHINETHLYEGNKYLFFIAQPKSNQNLNYFKYMFWYPRLAFSQIIDGKVYPQENANLFMKGEEIGSVINSINETLIINEKPAE